MYAPKLLVITSNNNGGKISSKNTLPSDLNGELRPKLSKSSKKLPLKKSSSGKYFMGVQMPLLASNQKKSKNRNTREKISSGKYFT